MNREKSIIWLIFTGAWLLTGIAFLLLGWLEGRMWIGMFLGSIFGYIAGHISKSLNPYYDKKN